MSGIIAAESVFRATKGLEQLNLPRSTMCGALTHYISSDDKKDFQPMGANFGIIEHNHSQIRDKQERYMKIAQKAIQDIRNSLNKN